MIRLFIIVLSGLSVPAVVVFVWFAIRDQSPGRLRSPLQLPSGGSDSDQGWRGTAHRVQDFMAGGSRGPDQPFLSATACSRKKGDRLPTRTGRRDQIGQ